MMQLPDSQATERLPQDLGQGQPSEQGILGFQITENDDTRNTKFMWSGYKKTSRRMARERRGAGSSLVSMETPY